MSVREIDLMSFRGELYYIAPISVVDSIMRYGILSHKQAAPVKHDNISDPVVQARRDKVKIPHGLDLHDYANLYFDAHNPMLCKRQNEAGRICVLIISQEVLTIPGSVISDRNASSGYVRFYSSPEGLEELDFDMIYSRDWRDANQFRYFEKKSRKCAELLVPHQISPDFITGALVANETAKAALAETSFGLTISVDPGTFDFRGSDD